MVNQFSTHFYDNPSPYADCKMCARLQISFVFLHILARETVGTSPVASLLAVGASKALSLIAPIGETSLSPNPIDQPYEVWMRTSLSPLDREQWACLPLCKPSFYPRDQPFADWIPPFHGDLRGVSQPL